MTKDDHDGNDKRQSREDGGKPARDANGRWLPGHCPNPNGRPRKKPKGFLHESDIRIFHSTLVDVVAYGQKETMDRRTALLNKMFESAMKGRVSIQRFLYQEFEKNDKLLAATRAHYDRLLFHWIIDNPRFTKPDFEMPREIEVEMQTLRAVLNHYHPGDYPPYGTSETNDDES